MEQSATYPSQYPVNDDTATNLPETGTQDITRQPNQIQQGASSTQRRRIKQYVKSFCRHKNYLFDSYDCFAFQIIHFRYAVSTQWERQQNEGRSIRDIHSYCCCCAKRIGNMFALVSKSDGTPVVIAGPCWPFCIFITLPLIIGISMLVIFFLILGDTFVLVRGHIVDKLCAFLHTQSDIFESINNAAQLDTGDLHSIRYHGPHFPFLCVMSGPWANGASHSTYLTQPRPQWSSIIS